MVLKLLTSDLGLQKVSREPTQGLQKFGRHDQPVFMKSFSVPVVEVSPKDMSYPPLERTSSRTKEVRLLDEISHEDILTKFKSIDTKISQYKSEIPHDEWREMDLERPSNSRSVSDWRMSDKDITTWLWYT